MKRYATLIVLALLSTEAAGFGQAPVPPPINVLPQPVPNSEKENWEVRIVPVRHANVDAVRGALQWFRADVTAQRDLKVLAVRAPKEIMPSVVEAIMKLDESMARPEVRNIEVVVHVVIAAESAPGGTRPVPASVQPVIDQLKNLLSYKSYSIADTLLLNATEGETIQSVGHWPDGLNLSPGMMPPRYSFSATPIVQGANKVVRLNDLKLQVSGGLEGPNKSWSTSYAATIETNADVPEGKQVVVGKTAVGDRAYILVVSAKVIN